MRILVVEDTADIAEIIIAGFRRIGHSVDWESDGAEARDLLATQGYDLVVLDLTLPGCDGAALLKALRGRGDATPVLVLTARAGIEERVRVLDLGADDYLVKPFDFREVEARARALLRRAAGEATNALVCGDIAIDRAARSVRVAGVPVELTRRELMLLEILAARPGRVFGKDELLDRLFSLDEAPSFNAVEQYVARLRRKLAPSEAQIRTLRGLGYQLTPKPGG
ncbi:response regulator transcription factor [Methylobacterium oryzihabitans]|uniref:Response regulator transcription factor n=1 Tax=Methylobacterium oryzihabitans TaxID=2499852 RepID=A0A3S2YRB1_9HYPH|nr:response regulator transcription factor [Methylobacterium oryzihabitans]RVU17191.1 response regulator transcription factor [Methylobacterium oryzihabitans]